jgi:hypothetical protein
MWRNCPQATAISQRQFELDRQDVAGVSRDAPQTTLPNADQRVIIANEVDTRRSSKSIGNESQFEICLLRRFCEQDLGG